MSPMSLSLAGKIWSDVIGSAGSRFAGRTFRAVRVRGSGPLTGPANSEHSQLRVRLFMQKNRAQQHLATDASKPRRAAELAEAGY